MSEIPLRIQPHEEKHMQVIPLGDDMPYDYKHPHRHAYFEFFLFRKGGGTHFIDFAGYPIHPHSVHVIFPSQVHLLKRKGASGRILICSAELLSQLDAWFYKELFEGCLSQPSVSFSASEFEFLDQLIGQFADLCKADQKLERALVPGYLSVFLGKCIEALQQTSDSTRVSPSPELQLYRRFAMMLEKDFPEKRNVAAYAKELLVSPKILSHAVKKATGKTCIDRIQQRTLTEAKRLLLFTDCSAKEIAWQLQFKDSSYFTRFFTRLQGQTPSAFRLHWEEKYQQSS